MDDASYVTVRKPANYEYILTQEKTTMEKDS